MTHTSLFELVGGNIVRIEQPVNTMTLPDPLNSYYLITAPAAKMDHIVVPQQTKCIHCEIIQL